MPVAPSAGGQQTAVRTDFSAWDPDRIGGRYQALIGPASRESRLSLEEGELERLTHSFHAEPFVDAIGQPRRS